MKSSASTSTRSADGKPPYVLSFYDGSENLIYRCENALHGAATSETDWQITKYTYGASGITGIEELVGSVDGRAALAWV